MPIMHGELTERMCQVLLCSAPTLFAGIIVWHPGEPGRTFMVMPTTLRALASRGYLFPARGQSDVFERSPTVLPRAVYDRAGIVFQKGL